MYIEERCQKKFQEISSQPQGIQRKYLEINFQTKNTNISQGNLNTGLHICSYLGGTHGS